MLSRFVLLVVLLLAGVAQAVEPKAGADKNQIKEDFRQANSFYNLGKFVEAAKLYESVYERFPDNALLYNIAQSYRLGGDAERALFFYKNYLRNEPKSPKRAEVNARVTDLLAVIRAQSSSIARGSSVPVQPSALRSEPSLPRDPEPTPVAVVEPRRKPVEPKPEPVDEPTTPRSQPTPARTAEPTTTAAATTTGATTTARPPEKTPIYKKWWLWTIVGGVVVVGVGVGVGVALAAKSPSFDSNFAEIGPGKGLVQF